MSDPSKDVSKKLVNGSSSITVLWFSCGVLLLFLSGLVAGFIVNVITINRK